jgi:polyphosphate kinase
MSQLPTLSYLLLDPKRPFIHRDLSWIQFNERVLVEARARTNPLLKRLKFLSITASNLDEFFQIRFASLLRSISATKNEEGKENLQRVHGTVLESVRKFGERQARCFDVLRKVASEQKVFLHLKCHKDSAAFQMGRELFQTEIFPQLIMKSGFRYDSLLELRNLQLLAFINKELFFEVPRQLPPAFCRIVDEEVHVFFLDDLLLSHLDHMLPLKEKPGILRISRDADFTVDLPEGDSESVPDLIRKNLGSRDKGRLVRLQYNGSLPKDFVEEACDSLKLDLRHAFRAPGTLCLHGLFSCMNDMPTKIAQKPGFNNPILYSHMPLPFEPKERGKLFTALRELDFILHHPYDSFDAFLSWLELSCQDPQVTMIEQTIYRTDSVSKIVEMLKEAAKTKKVKVILELRARFDEHNNLRVAEELSKAGVEVRFGFGSLKLHAKITLVTRKEDDKLVRYTHLSTGNYNAKTARAYTDISILTGNQEIGDDARHFFDSVVKNHPPSSFRHLVTAPAKLHQKIRAQIKAETEAAKEGKKVRIFAKVNALVDEKIIEDLYTASQAGVHVDLLVRGACSLIPGVKGLSENIRVYSIVDRFLEHSRIYYFSNSGSIYLSSADWMPRNFFSRLEIAFPILDPRIHRFLVEVVIPGYLKDNTNTRRLTSRGTWEKVPRGEQEHRAQWYFEKLAAKGYEGTPLFDHPFFSRSSKS